VATVEIRWQVAALEEEVDLWRMHEQTMRKALDKLLGLVNAEGIAQVHATPVRARDESSFIRTFHSPFAATSPNSRSVRAGKMLVDATCEDEQDIASVIDGVVRVRDALRASTRVSLERRALAVSKHEAALNVSLEALEATVEAVRCLPDSLTCVAFPICLRKF
jgi:hypothetical protein